MEDLRGCAEGGDDGGRAEMSIFEDVLKEEMMEAVLKEEIIEDVGYLLCFECCPYSGVHQHDSSGVGDTNDCQVVRGSWDDSEIHSLHSCT